MKKLVKLLLLAIAAVLIFTTAACGASFDYDKDAAFSRAKEVIELSNAGDYQSVCDTFSEILSAQLSLEQLKTALDPILTAAGSFEAYKNIKAAGLTENDVDYIVVIAVCEYENNTHTYTISMTTDMMLTALYIK